MVDTLAYVADGTSGSFLIVDVSDPMNPDTMGSLNSLYSPYDVVISQGLAYVADYDSGLQVIDVSNPTTPVEVGSYVGSWTAYGLDYAGDHVYIAGLSNGLRVIDVSDSSAPLEVGTFPSRQQSDGVTLSGNLVFVADGYSGLMVVDVTNPASPVEVGYFDTPGDASEVAVVDSLIYVSDTYSLEIFRMTPAVGVAEKRRMKTRISGFRPRLLQSKPNPFSTETVIRYQIPTSCDVTLGIYDVSGRLVETLVNQVQKMGTYQVSWDAESHGNGIYFYRLQAGDFSDAGKMVLLR